MSYGWGPFQKFVSQMKCYHQIIAIPETVSSHYLEHHTTSHFKCPNSGNCMVGATASSPLHPLNFPLVPWHQYALFLAHTGASCFNNHNGSDWCTCGQLGPLLSPIFLWYWGVKDQWRATVDFDLPG